MGLSAPQTSEKAAMPSTIAIMKRICSVSVVFMQHDALFCGRIGLSARNTTRQA
jgi:hypothetical protein